MKNTMVMAKRMMNDVRASGAKLDTMDDLYAVVSNYASMTKDQFVDSYNQVKEEMGNELSDCELDMVVGGGVGDFFKDHWKEILICSAILLTCTAVGVGFGAMMAIGATGQTAGMALGIGVTEITAETVGTVTAASYAGCCTVGGLIGAGIGGVAAYSAVNN